VSDSLLEALRNLLGERVSTATAILAHHGKDESHHAAAPPNIVVFPETSEEVATIVRLCADERIPVIPFGAGTSLEGGISAVHGGVCIDMMEMNRIIQINADDLDVTVEAGVTRKQLNADLRDTGLFFPIDPGADATLGGMASTRASGTNAVRYGTMRENVLNVKAVLANGRLIQTGGRARKSAAGYDLTRMFVGAEGTLGVITEVTVRLYGVPEAISAAVCGFSSIEAAVRCCMLTIQSGIPVARVELLDATQMRACIQYSDLDCEPVPTLLFEFHGSQASVREQAVTVQEIASEFGGGDFQWAERTEDRNKLWQARHDALYATLALKPGFKAWATDVCVPVSSLADCIEETRSDIEVSSLTATMVGHVGDGNFHVIFLLDPDRPQDLAEAQRINDRMVTRAIAMDGTCTGEHGIGTGKQHCLEQEFGDALDTMRDIKRVLDPLNIMNPGKIFTLGS
jgi:D-lactate dehydrogenase (cytochrome)